MMWDVITISSTTDGASVNGFINHWSASPNRTCHHAKAGGERSQLFYLKEHGWFRGMGSYQSIDAWAQQVGCDRGC